MWLNKPMYLMVGKYFTQLGDLARLRRLKSSVFTELSDLKAEYTYADEPIPFSERKNGIKPISVGESWCKKLFGCGWFHFTGKVPESGKGKKVALEIDVEGEGCLYDDGGNPVCGITDVSTYAGIFHLCKGKKLLSISDFSTGNEEIDVWIEVGNNRRSEAKLKQAKIVSINSDAADFYYDYLVLSMLKPSYANFSQKFNSIQKALNQSYREAKAGSSEKLKKASLIIENEEKNGEEMTARAYATGHAHLDLGWLWPIRETKRKAERTFTNQLKNIEKYPDYVFGVSQPQQLEWMEELRPELFEKLREAVKNGRVEPQGGTWVECDTNLTGGESLVRQCIYGKTYWKEKFGADVKFGWLPDCFGFNGNLPQIFKKCGMNDFLTIKISWNKQTAFPRRSFIWEGIDGSTLTVHMPPGNDYNNDGLPMLTMGAYKCYPDRDKTEVFGIPFGCGDGGGGPGEGYIEIIKRQKDVKGHPKVEMAPAKKLFEELEKDKEKFLTVKGELYLETHQGTYTTQSNSKNLNRRIEFKLHNVEFLATVAGKYGYPYPKLQLDKIWKEVLLYQFHDIIPGSSIERIYTESVARYKEMLEELSGLEREALGYLKRGDGLYAYNANPFAAREIIPRGGKLYLAAPEPYSAAPLEEYVCGTEFSIGKDYIESPLYRVEFNSEGNVKSLKDKINGREIVKTFLNKLRVFKDTPKQYDAWNIYWKYMNKTPEEFALVSSRSFIENGCAVMENNYKLNKSKILQRVVLSAESPLIDFQTEIDWQETHKMLRAEFRPTVFADAVSCDIQMGVLKRTTKNRTKKERAQFEICAHKWVDVSSDDYGLSVLSASKYGWRVKEGLISLNLLRSPMYPAKDADKGKHTFKYALYPHKGTLDDGETVKLAYNYNNPVTVLDYAIDLKPQFSVNEKNIVIETVKVAENGSGTVVRLYENAGKQTTVRLKAEGFASAKEADMTENIIADADLESLKFSPYEIKTLILY